MMRIWQALVATIPAILIAISLIGCAHENTTDYRRADYQQFFTACRDYLRKRGQQEADA